MKRKEKGYVSLALIWLTIGRQRCYLRSHMRIAPSIVPLQRAYCQNCKLPTYLLSSKLKSIQSDQELDVLIAHNRSMVKTHWPVVRSHSLIVLSFEPESYRKKALHTHYQFRTYLTFTKSPIEFDLQVFDLQNTSK